MTEEVLRGLPSDWIHACKRYHTWMLGLRNPFFVILFIVYLGFYVAFNTVQVISRRVVGRAEETSTYSSLGFCTVNCRPMASNYQLSHLRPWRGSNPGRRGGRPECYHSATVAPFFVIIPNINDLYENIYSLVNRRFGQKSYFCKKPGLCLHNNSLHIHGRSDSALVQTFGRLRNYCSSSSWV